LVSDNNELLGLTVKEIPEFIAGFLYGWTGDNDLVEVEACYASELPIYEDIQTSLDDLL
jgi:hypothetical protein